MTPPDKILAMCPIVLCLCIVRYIKMSCQQGTNLDNGVAPAEERRGKGTSLYEPAFRQRIANNIPNNKYKQ